MNRRSLLKGSLALATGLILPPTLAENAEAARRYWSLDRTMVPPVTMRIQWWAEEPYSLGSLLSEEEAATYRAISIVITKETNPELYEAIRQSKGWTI